MMNRKRVENLAVEEQVDLIVNGRKVTKFMCSTEDLDFLAMGYMVSMGLIQSLGDIVDLTVKNNFKTIEISCRNVTKSSPTELKNNSSDKTFLFNDLINNVKYMFDNAVKYKKTGGMHCAAIVLDDGQCRMFEDVGRHNAVDKAIGYGLSIGTNFSRCGILSSGRIALEIIKKIATSGIPLIVSRSIPTTSAYEFAVEHGISLIGRITSENPIIYTREERISGLESAKSTGGSAA